MSVEAIRWAWTLDIPASTKDVLLALSDHANNQFEAWPFIETVAKKISRAKSTVVDALHALTEAGLIRKLGRRGRAVVYRVLVGARPVRKVRLRRHVASPQSSPEATSSVAGGDFQSSPKATLSTSPLLIPEPPFEPSVKKRRFHEQNPNQLRLAWPEVLKQVQVRVNPHHFFTWYHCMHPLDLRKDTMTVGVPNEYFSSWLNDHRDVIVECACAAGVDVRAVKFREMAEA